jgi:general L-amino acid transport system substrate-binding protein
MKKINRLLVLSLTVVMLAALALPAVSAQEGTSILDEVKARGYLNCGVNTGLNGFAALDPNTNEWQGFDADYCRAVAAAVFGEVTADNLKFVPVTTNERFTALQTHQIDVLIRNTTWTLQRDGTLGVDFGPTTFYDGQGLMVKANLGVNSITELDGATICTLTGTTTALNVTETMTKLGLAFELVPFEQSSETAAAFQEGRCDALTSDLSQLAGIRAELDDPGSAVILPDVISKEPLGPVYIENDSTWGDVVDWAVYATFFAEEIGMTSENVDTFLASDDPAIQRFLGVGDNESGVLIDLDNDFVVNVIHAVGNYGEIFERNLVPIGLQRGKNAQWTDGGLLYAPAWR